MVVFLLAVLYSHLKNPQKAYEASSKDAPSHIGNIKLS